MFKKTLVAFLADSVFFSFNSIFRFYFESLYVKIRRKKYKRQILKSIPYIMRNFAS